MSQERRWNQVPTEPVRFWDPNVNDGRGVECQKLMASDLSLIKNYGQARYEDTLRALCHVVAELVEVEEARSSSGSSNPPPDEL